MDKKYYLLILLGLGLLTRFLFFGHPDQTVFDEVHFGKFVSGYYTREYFFDIHPPLGKMMIAGFASLFGFEPGFAFAEIGNRFPDNQYMLLRFLPSLAGSLLPAVFYLLLITMGINRTASFFGGLFIVLENAFLTQSHYILLDSFLILFGCLSLIFYFKAKDNYSSRKYWILFGLSAGLTISIKWTGLGFLALPLLLEFFRNVGWKGEVKKMLDGIFLPLAISLFVYLLVFTIHLTILNKSGPGDAFMSTGFQKTLIGNQHAEVQIKKSNLMQKFTELNMEMYKANQRLDADHPYSSPWYSWPFMARSIYYWVGSNSSPQVSENSRIYLLGNPVIWWTSTLAILILISRFLNNFRSETKNFISVFLISSYIINMLPFIGVSRVMFLYHYFTAYIFAIITLVYLISQLKNSKKVFGVLIALSLILFVFFAPLSYGLNLSPDQFKLRMWFDNWE